MRLAIQEDMLPGQTVLERFETARSMGFQGVEVWGQGLTLRVPEITDAMQKTGVVVSAVNHGQQSDLLHPDRIERESALAELRQSVVDGVDIGAAGVIVVPHFGAPTVPDLTPYKSVVQLEYELLHNHLRTLSDYVYAIGIDLYIEPINRYETHFLNTLADAARVRRKIKDHPHIKICADMFHMAMEEASIPQALREYANDLGYIHLADNNRRLPGQGMMDFAAIATTLSEVGYDGWVSLACGQPGRNGEQAKHFMAALPATIETISKAGFIV
jgi:sugar phosphate isomerase/epimerase